MAEPNRILVTRNDKLGDVIVSTPVFLSLRQSFPNAHIAALVSLAGFEVLKDNPHLNEVLVDDTQGEHQGRRGFKQLVAEVKQRNFDSAIILFSDWRMGQLCMMAGIPKRICPASKLAQLLYTKRIRQRRSKSIKHEADYNLELAAELGASIIRKTELWTPDFVKQRAQQFFDKLDIDPKAPIIGIHPGGGGSSRNWSIKRYAELGNELIDKLGATIFVTNGPGEEELVTQLADSLKTPAYRYPNHYGVQFLAELIKRFNICVSANTGPMHIAAAVGTPTVSLFSPLIVTRPQRWGPIGNKHVVLSPKLPECKNCRPKHCGHADCLELIPISEVLAAINKLL